MRIKFSVVGFLLLAACQLLMNAPRRSAYSISEEPPQFSDWLTYENLGPTVNTSFNDYRPAISKDGLSLFYIADSPGFGVPPTTDIWVVQRDSVDSPWGPPQNLGGTINTPSVENAPSFSSDGHWMYFDSDRPGGCGGFDIWVSHRQNKKDDFGWETPINLGCTFNAFDDGGATFFEDESTGESFLYFTSNRPGGPLPELGFGNIWVAHLTTDYTTFDEPILVSELSSPYRDTRTSIRKDGLEIAFSSDRPGGKGGLDIWQSTRASTSDPWSTPVSLPFPINTSANDGAPSFSRDGTTMYFDSTRPGGFGLRDLVVSTRKKF